MGLGKPKFVGIIFVFVVIFLGRTRGLLFKK